MAFPPFIVGKLTGLLYSYSALEDHSRDFINLACPVHFPLDGQRKDFAVFVEWDLVNICLNEKDFISPASYPVTTQLTLHYTERYPEPTSDTKLKPAVMSAPERLIKPIITLEPEPHRQSDQVHESLVPHCLAQNSCVSTKPPSPTSSSNIRQFLSTSSAGSVQPLDLFSNATV